MYGSVNTQYATKNQCWMGKSILLNKRHYIGPLSIEFIIARERNRSSICYSYYFNILKGIKKCIKSEKNVIYEIGKKVISTHLLVVFMIAREIL